MTNIEVTLSNYPVVAGRSCWNVSYQTVLVRQYGTTNTTTVLSLTALLIREEPFRNNKEEPTDLIYFDGKFSWVPTFTRSLRTYLKFTNLKKNKSILSAILACCVCVQSGNSYHKRQDKMVPVTHLNYTNDTVTLN